MLLDFENRPETPRVEQVISVREAVLLSLVAHLVLVIAILLAPKYFFSTTAAEPVQLVKNNDTIRFVEMRPLVDRSAPPKRPAEQSDLDRRSTTLERPPDATNPQPFTRGNTSEHAVGGETSRAAGPETPAPPAPAPPPPASPPAPQPDSTKVMPELTAPPQRAASGSLGQALRNLQRYLQSDTTDNAHGGNTEQSADIQFDSMGVDFGPWLERFKRQIERNWIVPEAAMSLKGRVAIQFYVLRSGTLLELHVAQPSTIESFNTSAMTALKLSNPTSALPAEYPADRVFFTVTFHYNEDPRSQP